VVCEAAFSTLVKPLATRIRALSIATMITTGIEFAVYLPLAVVQGWGFDVGSVSMRVWLGVKYYAVMATVVPYLLWYDALRWVPASTAGVFTGVMPVSAVALSAVVLGESLSAAHLTGMVCVLAALGLTVVEPRRPVADEVVAPGAVRARG
jgi:drug/metabolite transporter (DMT)-like permease